jgi:hypothetical protein
VEGSAIGVTEYGNPARAHFTASAQNAHGDFSAIGNENFPEHCRVNLRRENSIALERGYATLLAFSGPALLCEPPEMFT